MILIGFIACLVIGVVAGFGTHATSRRRLVGATTFLFACYMAAWGWAVVFGVVLLVQKATGA